MSWFILALMSVLFYSFSTIFQKKLMGENNSDPVAFMIVFQFLVTGILLIYILFSHTTFPNLIYVWPNLILNGILIAIGSLCMFKALKITEASEYTIISTFSVIINLFFASVFLHEVITLNKLIGTIFIIASILIIAFKAKNNPTKIHKGHLFSLLSAIGFGTAFSNESYIVGQIGVIQNLVIGFFLPGLLVLLIKPKSLQHVRNLLPLTSLFKIIIFSILYLFGAITIFAAYTQGGDAGKIYGISNSTVIATVILSAIFLGEKDKPLRKIIATISAFAGIMLLR